MADLHLVNDNLPTRDFEAIPKEKVQQLSESIEKTSKELSKSLYLKSIPYFWWQIEVWDNFVESNTLSIMLPWITPNGPYAYWDMYEYQLNMEDAAFKWLETYGWKSPFTETLEDLAWEKESQWKVRTLQFNYPNKADRFDIESYMQTIEEYIEKNCWWIKWKNISVYWQSMWWKTAIYTASKLIEKWANVEKIILYAPALEADLLVPSANLLNCMPTGIATFFQKFIAWPMMHYQIFTSEDWWVELSQQDLQKLSKYVAWYDVVWKQMKDRLKFISDPIDWQNGDFSFLKALKNIDSNTDIIVLLSDIGNWTDGVLDNNKIWSLVNRLFPNQMKKFIEIWWLPHVNVPQAAKLHKIILEKKL